ncbi:MAG: peroxiredoxin-like family protein [Pseudomonadota bacterium]
MTHSTTRKLGYFALLLSLLGAAGLALAQNPQTRTLGASSLIDQPALAMEMPDYDAIGTGPMSIRPLLPGSPAPEFKVSGMSGSRLSFSPKHLERPVVVTFFRGGWCPYCVTQFSGLRNIEAELVELGYDIWFISPDRPELLSFGDPGPDAPYKLYSDSDLSAARAFGIAYQLSQTTLERYFEGGRLLASYSGLETGALPVPSSFIISKNGEVVFQYSSPDHTRRIQPELLLTAARLNVENMASRSLGDFVDGESQGP